jgi:hypothetical protein
MPQTRPTQRHQCLNHPACTASFKVSARCGALWVIFAAAMIARPIIRVGYRNWYLSTKTIDGGSFKPTAEEIEEGRQSDIDALCVQILGPCLAILGTLLWAYGDLLATIVIKEFCAARG